MYTSLRALKEDLKIKRSAYLFAAGRTFYARRFGYEHTAAEFIVIRPSAYEPMEEDPGSDILVQRLAEIPDHLLHLAAAVCLDIYRQHRAEMVMLLRWDHGYRLEAPEFSIVEPAGVSYYTAKPFSGTVHYHPGGIGPKPSSTDDRDEMWTPGIHVILSRANPNCKEEGPYQDDLIADAFLTGNGVRKPISTMTRLFAGQVIDKAASNNEPYIEKVRTRVMHFDELLSKKTGYYLIDADIPVFWFPTEEEAEANKGKLEVLSVRQLKIAGVSPEEARRVAKEMVEEMAKGPSGKPMLRYVKEAIDEMLGG